MTERDPRVEKTAGWEDMMAWLDAEVPDGEPRRSAGGLAKLLGKKQPSVRAWVERLSRPTAGAVREAVCRITGSSPERWETRAEKAERERLAEVASDKTGTEGN